MSRAGEDFVLPGAGRAPSQKPSQEPSQELPQKPSQELPQKPSQEPPKSRPGAAAAAAAKSVPQRPLSACTFRSAA